MAALGYKFRFPLDTDNTALPTLSDGTNNQVANYLRNVSEDSQFSKEVIKILTEERQEYHRLRKQQDNQLSPTFKI